MLVDLLFFQIFTFIGSSVIYLSLSEIPIWTHQRQFGFNCRIQGNKKWVSGRIYRKMREKGLEK